ncbi:hypothetical protein L596_030889 [Steinernema carpocapsae]|uniref:Uncharacterized protein n=1 Tax=Steinernema carpocapsae TaxID=34508 RepID=A0A4U5LNF7_STECR|nr:hypothetical protein L596_030889 [Steinernema carpocapsae]
MRLYSVLILGLCALFANGAIIRFKRSSSYGAGSSSTYGSGYGFSDNHGYSYHDNNGHRESSYYGSSSGFVARPPGAGSSYISSVGMPANPLGPAGAVPPYVPAKSYASSHVDSIPDPLGMGFGPASSVASGIADSDMSIPSSAMLG